MIWDTYLIALYLRICKSYRQQLWTVCQRFTSGGKPHCSDEEIMVVYLYGLLRGYTDIKMIYQYTRDHLSDWFPTLPGYAGFVYRVNRLSEAFRYLLIELQGQEPPQDDEEIYLIDSFGIALAHHQHAYRAKVAPELAAKSYNATKKQYYYGVKAHVVARQRPGQCPIIECLWFEQASTQDGPMFDQLRPLLVNHLVIGDKAYRRPDAEAIERDYDLKVLTPPTKPPGQSLTNEQRRYSKQVSSWRQPIESLFAWLDRTAHLQNAQRVRSTKGLLTFIFGRLVAAMLRFEESYA